MLALFREEVIKSQPTHWLGDIRVARNPRFSVVAGAAALVGLALVAYAWLGQVSRKSKIPGLLTPVAGSVQLVSPISGVLLERRVLEGAIVSAGDVLFTVGEEH